jgi:hypothetical protein
MRMREYLLDPLHHKIIAGDNLRMMGGNES